MEEREERRRETADYCGDLVVVVVVVVRLSATSR